MQSARARPQLFVQTRQFCQALDLGRNRARHAHRMQIERYHTCQLANFAWQSAVELICAQSTVQTRKKWSERKSERSLLSTESVQLRSNLCELKDLCRYGSGELAIACRAAHCELCGQLGRTAARIVDGQTHNSQRSLINAISFGRLPTNRLFENELQRGRWEGNGKKKKKKKQNHARELHVCQTTDLSWN
jgi:hypothetical protein